MDGHGKNGGARSCMAVDPDRPRSSIASPTQVNPSRYASSVRKILLPEALTERLFLGNDLHQGDNSHEQWWDDQRTDAPEPDRPPDEQQYQPQIHWIPANAKDAVRHKVRGFAWVQRANRRSGLTETYIRGYGDGDSDRSRKPAQSVPRRSDPVTERHPMIQCQHEPGREQHQDRRRNVDPHRRTRGNGSGKIGRRHP